MTTDPAPRAPLRLEHEHALALRFHAGDGPIIKLWPEFDEVDRQP